MIIRGGENIYPKEIEDFIYTHPEGQGRAGHRRARRAVRRGNHGLRHPASEGETLTEDETEGLCPQPYGQAQDARATSTFVDAFPMNAAGKILKYKMRENAVEQLGLQKASKIVTA